MKLTTLAPQVSYFKPKRPNYYAKTVPFQSCGSAVVPGSKHRAGPLNHVSNKNQFLTRSEKLKPHRVPLSELSSSKPLIKLIKKDQSVIARHLAQLTKMQPKVIYKG